MITNKTKYALKALHRLATLPQDEPILIAELAELEQIPRKFLELILVELKQHGILKSRKGRGGGYSLAKAPKDISLADVLRITDGPLAPVPCLSKTGYERCGECQDEVSCAVRLGFKDPYGEYVRSLENTTLADMVERVSTSKETRAPVLRYSI
ncbi:MAG: Rrf2 family transcriptional regulator [Polyangiaceae bacterium]